MKKYTRSLFDYKIVPGLMRKNPVKHTNIR